LDHWGQSHSPHILYVVLICCSALAVCSSLLTQRTCSATPVACHSHQLIAGGNVQQIQLIIDAQMIAPLLSILKEESEDHGTCMLILEVLHHITAGGTAEQIRYVAAQGALTHFCDFLAHPKDHLVERCLDCMKDVLQQSMEDASVIEVAQEVNPELESVRACGGVEKLRALRNHDNRDVVEKAVAILAELFGEGGEEDGRAGR
jgi:importin subunit alpha-1